MDHAMSRRTYVYRGACHCGAIALELSLSRPAEEAPVRSCDCGFCRAHGARTVTDARGHVHIRFENPGRVRRYRFGLKTADFLICGRCGVYVGAVAETADGPRATINVNALAARSSFDPNPPSVAYDSETRAARLDRRARRWTPATIESGRHATGS